MILLTSMLETFSLLSEDSGLLSLINIKLIEAAC